MLRQKFGMQKDAYFPIVRFIELILPAADPCFQLLIVPDLDLPGRAAETLPELHEIRIKESVYDAACSGHHWARTVMAHELGHYMYHSAENVAYAYPDPGERVPAGSDPERQADIFAAELLAPVHLIHGKSDYLVSKNCGVTLSVAKSQLQQVQRIDKRHQKKKNGSAKS